MGFADKYRKNIMDTTRSFLDKDSKAKADRKNLDEEEKRKKEEWKQRRKKLSDKDAENEAAMVSTIGNVVMATGFMDTYVNDFSLLSGIVRYAMEMLEKDEGAREQFMAYSMLKNKEDKKKPVKTAVPDDKAADEVQDADEAVAVAKAEEADGTEEVAAEDGK